mmetsp:Transcript_9263/g.13547  ORF Transcript_9263/g.13547 Transcript_9263/m.13547 type:complete len:236 (+) Transcript_9263:1482-2189(+)
MLLPKSRGCEIGQSHACLCHMERAFLHPQSETNACIEQIDHEPQLHGRNIPSNDQTSSSFQSVARQSNEWIGASFLHHLAQLIHSLVLVSSHQMVLRVRSPQLIWHQYLRCCYFLLPVCSHCRPHHVLHHLLCLGSLQMMSLCRPLWSLMIHLPLAFARFSPPQSPLLAPQPLYLGLPHLAFVHCSPPQCPQLDDRSFLHCYSSDLSFQQVYQDSLRLEVLLRDKGVSALRHRWW